MNPKLLLCLALALSGGLAGCYRTPIYQTHGISLSESETQIRASILKITPLGTPLKDVKARIQTKLCPDTFYYSANGAPMPGKWPLGGEHHGKVFTCQIGEVGEGGFWDFPVAIDADWAFDDKDRLADVFVYKIRKP
jgi:hypothetical protein